jgi:hypothetical protein
MQRAIGIIMAILKWLYRLGPKILEEAQHLGLSMEII